MFFIFGNRNKLNVKKFALPTFSFCTLVILFYASYSDIKLADSNEFIKKLDFYYIFLALFLLIIHQLLSTARFNLLKRKLGSNLNFFQSNEINIQSLIYKTFFIIPIFFEIIGRSTHSKLLGDKSFSNTVNVTMIEKLSSLLSIFAILLFFLFLQYDLLKPNKMYLMYYLCIFLFLAFLFFIIFLINLKFKIIKKDKIKKGLLELIKQQNRYVFLLSFSIHLTSIFALYFLILQFYDLDKSFLLMLSSFIIASQIIPISISGWGTREITALITFNYFDLGSNEGILCSTIFGLIYLTALLVNWLTNQSLLKFYKLPKVIECKYKPKTSNYKSFVYLFSIFIFILLPINFFLPINGFNTKFTLADGFVLFFGLNIIVNWILRKRKKIWIGSYTGRIFVLLLITLTIGWFIGFLNFNSNSWAYINRLSGSVIIICYLFAGLGIAKYIKINDVNNLIYLLIISIYCSIFYQYFFDFYFDISDLGLYTYQRLTIMQEVSAFLRWSEGMPTGFFLDRNALGLSIIISITYLLSKISNNSFKKIDAYIILISSLIILLSGSRTSALSLVILLFSAFCYYYYYFKKIEPMFKKLIFYTLFLIFLYFLSLFYYSIVSVNNAIPLLDITGARGIFEYLSISEHRLYLVSMAIKSFMSDPIFGIGLGGFIDLKESGNVPEYCIKIGLSESCQDYNIIHSTHLWVATEFGLFGIIVYLLFLYNILNCSRSIDFRDIRKPLILFTLVVFVTFSFFHDIIYQRIIWIIIGFCLSQTIRKKYIK